MNINTAIMTDSNSGIFAEEGRRLGVFVLPMPVILEGQTRYEGQDLDAREFFRALSEHKNVSTSQPSPGDLLSLWDELLSGYDDLVYIPMSSALSSTFDTARALARDYGGRVQVADGRRISLAQRDAVLDARALAEQGHNAAEIRAAIEASAADQQTYVGVETLEYLKRSGRVTAAGAAIGTILGIRPLLKIADGKLDAYAKVRGGLNCRRRMLEAICACVGDYQGRGWDVSVAVADSCPDPKDSEAWLEMARTALPGCRVGRSPLTFSVAAHVGANAYGAAVSRRIARMCDET